MGSCVCVCIYIHKHIRYVHICFGFLSLLSPANLYNRHGSVVRGRDECGFRGGYEGNGGDGWTERRPQIGRGGGVRTRRGRAFVRADVCVAYGLAHVQPDETYPVRARTTAIIPNLLYVIAAADNRNCVPATGAQQYTPGIKLLSFLYAVYTPLRVWMRRVFVCPCTPVLSITIVITCAAAAAAGSIVLRSRRARR